MHDDSGLPPLTEQLALLGRARMLNAAGGAGFVLLLAARPGTCVVHWWHAEHYFFRNHLPLARLAYALGLQYYGLPMRYEGWAVAGHRLDFHNQTFSADLPAIESAMCSCLPATCAADGLESV